MNKRQRRKLAKSLDCIHLKLADCGAYKCELKDWCNAEYELKDWCYAECCKSYEFSRKELKRTLQNRSANRRMLKKAMKLNGHTIKSYECKHYGI